MRLTVTQKMVSKAKENGYEPVLVGRQIRTNDCPDCGKKAILFTNNNGIYVRACVCGHREKRAAKQQQQQELWPSVPENNNEQCQAQTKKGTRCKNKPVNGLTCAQHDPSILSY